MRDLAAELRGTAARERRHGRNDVPQLCEDAADELAALRAERDQFKAMWERDSTALGKALAQRDTARVDAEDKRARVAELEAERASLLEAAQKSRERAARLELKHGRLTTGGPDV